MARNEEKQLGKLNRLHLQKQHDEELRKHPRRPHLGSLKSAEDIQKWLPSISYDLNKSLKELEVPCYPERKIREVEKKVRYLEKEYKSFVAKYKELSTSADSSSAPKNIQIPWTDRPYNRTTTKRVSAEALVGQESKNLRVSNSVGLSTEPYFSAHQIDAMDRETSGEPSSNSLSFMDKRISLPLLDGDIEASYICPDPQPSNLCCYDLNTLDTPLTFKPNLQPLGIEGSKESKHMALKSDWKNNEASNDCGTTADGTFMNREDSTGNEGSHLLVNYSSSGSESDQLNV